MAADRPQIRFTVYFAIQEEINYGRRKTEKNYYKQILPHNKRSVIKYITFFANMSFCFTFLLPCFISSILEKA